MSSDNLDSPSSTRGSVDPPVMVVQGYPPPNYNPQAYPQQGYPPQNSPPPTSNVPLTTNSGEPTTANEAAPPPSNTTTADSTAKPSSTPKPTRTFNTPELFLFLGGKILHESMSSWFPGRIVFIAMAALYFILQFFVGLRKDYLDLLKLRPPSNSEEAAQRRLDIQNNLDILPIMCMTLGWGFFSMLSFYGTRAGTRLVYMKNKYFFGWLFYVGTMVVTLIASSYSANVYKVKDDDLSNLGRGIFLFLYILFSYYILLFGTVIAEQLMDLVESIYKQKSEIDPTQLSKYSFNTTQEFLVRCFGTFMIVGVAVPITIAILLTNSVEGFGILVAVAVPLIGIGILGYDLIQNRNKGNTSSSSSSSFDLKEFEEIIRDGWIWQVILIVIGIVLISVGKEVKSDRTSMSFFEYLGGNFLGRVIGVKAKRSLSWLVDKGYGGKVVKYIEFIFALATYLIGLTIDLSDDKVIAGFGFANGLLQGIAIEEAKKQIQETEIDQDAVNARGPKSLIGNRICTFVQHIFEVILFLGLPILVATQSIDRDRQDSNGNDVKIDTSIMGGFIATAVVSFISYFIGRLILRFIDTNEHFRLLSKYYFLSGWDCIMLYKLTEVTKQDVSAIYRDEFGYLYLHYLGSISLGIIIGSSVIIYKAIPYGENSDKKTWASTYITKQTIIYILLSVVKATYEIGVEFNKLAKA